METLTEYIVIKVSDVYEKYPRERATDFVQELMNLSRKNVVAVPSHFPEYRWVVRRWCDLKLRLPEFSQQSIFPGAKDEQHRNACEKLAEIKKLLES